MFSVISWGNSGRPWLCDCLNLHPRLRAVVCNRQQGESAAAYIRRLCAADDRSLTISGDIGSITSEEFAGLRAAFSDRCRCAIITGHPVQRYAGSLAISKQMGRNWNRAYMEELWNAVGESFDQIFKPVIDIFAEADDHVPAHYALHVARSPDEIATSGAYPVNLNALLESDAAWEDFVHAITNGAVTDYGTRWRKFQNSCPDVAHAPLLQTPEAVWASLSQQQRQVFAAMVMPDVREKYQKLGFDLSFVTPTNRV